MLLGKGHEAQFSTLPVACGFVTLRFFESPFALVRPIVCWKEMQGVLVELLQAGAMANTHNCDFA